MDLTELLAFVVKNKASDLHLSSGLPPMIRVHGDVRRINVPPMEHKDVHGMIYDIMNDGQRKFYEENLECDFSFAVPNLARFRVNAFVQQRGAAAVMRTIPSKILSLDDLKCPKIFAEIADLFPAAEKEMVRAMLSESIRAVISQTLLKTKDGAGRCAAHEIMIGTPAIRNLIRENKIAQMYSAIQTGRQIGMQTLDQNLQ